MKKCSPSSLRGVFNVRRLFRRIRRDRNAVDESLPTLVGPLSTSHLLATSDEARNVNSAIVKETSIEISIEAGTKADETPSPTSQVDGPNNAVLNADGSPSSSYHVNVPIITVSRCSTIGRPTTSARPPIPTPVEQPLRGASLRHGPRSHLNSAYPTHTNLQHRVTDAARRSWPLVSENRFPAIITTGTVRAMTPVVSTGSVEAVTPAIETVRADEVDDSSTSGSRPSTGQSEDDVETPPTGNISSETVDQPDIGAPLTRVSRTATVVQSIRDLEQFYHVHPQSTSAAHIRVRLGVPLRWEDIADLNFD